MTWKHLPLLLHFYTDGLQTKWADNAELCWFLLVRLDDIWINSRVAGKIRHLIAIVMWRHPNESSCPLKLQRCFSKCGSCNWWGQFIGVMRLLASCCRNLLPSVMIACALRNKSSKYNPTLDNGSTHINHRILMVYVYKKSRVGVHTLLNQCIAVYFFWASSWYK